MFSNKVVVITGSSSGIGAHAAIEFAKLGACVVLHGRNGESLMRVRKECLVGGKVEDEKIAFVIGDICSQSIQDQLIKSAVEKYGKVDILVNNAGTMKPTPIKDFDMAAFDANFNVNFNAVVSLTMKCLPHLISSKGCIVNVSSDLSTRPMIGTMGYCVSKTALDGFTRALAAEVALLGVRVNSVNPGPIPTNITRECNPIPANVKLTLQPRDYKDTPRVVPMSRYGTTMETSKAILFLASEQSSYTTGNILMVDGGLYLSTLTADIS